MSTAQERAEADLDDADRYPFGIAITVPTPGVTIAMATVYGPANDTALAEANATIERVRALLGDRDGALWAVRGVREADIRAALDTR
ncbi:MAG TPA: hypothetical protein VIM47_00745 [Dermatophilaceae bacterium]